MKPVAGLLVALFTAAPLSAAAALDYRVAGDTDTGLGLIDADAVTVLGTKRRVVLTVIFPEQGGEPANVGVANVLIDCEVARFRIESAVSYDIDLNELDREDNPGGWQAPRRNTPFYAAADFVCRGGGLPRAEAQELKDIIAGFLLRRSGVMAI